MATDRKLVENFIRAVLLESVQTSHPVYLKTYKELIEQCGKVIAPRIETLKSEINSKVEGREVEIVTHKFDMVGNYNRVLLPTSFLTIGFTLTLKTELSRNEDIIGIDKYDWLSVNTREVTDSSGNRFPLKPMTQTGKVISQELVKYFKQFGVDVKTHLERSYDFDRRDRYTPYAIAALSFSFSFNDWSDVLKLDHYAQETHVDEPAEEDDAPVPLGHNTQVLRDMLQEKGYPPPKVDSARWIRLLIDRSDSTDKSMRTLIRNIWYHELPSPGTWLTEVLSEIAAATALQIFEKFFDKVLEKFQAVLEQYDLSRYTRIAKQILTDDSVLDYEEIGPLIDDMYDQNWTIVRNQTQQEPERQREDTLLAVNFHTLVVSCIMWYKTIVKKREKEQDDPRYAVRDVSIDDFVNNAEEVFTMASSLMSTDTCLEILRQVIPPPEEIKQQRITQ